MNSKGKKRPLDLDHYRQYVINVDIQMRNEEVKMEQWQWRLSSRINNPSTTLNRIKSLFPFSFFFECVPNFIHYLSTFSLQSCRSTIGRQMDFFPFFSNIFPMSVQKDYVLLHHTTSFVFLTIFSLNTETRVSNSNWRGLSSGVRVEFWTR